MDPGDNDEPSREQLAARVEELEANQAEQREWWEDALPSRRGVLTAGAGVGLGALLSGSASGQSAAGQVGTQSSPEDVFAFDLDVQGALQRELDAGGQAITNAGSVSTGGVLTKTDAFWNVPASTYSSGGSGTFSDPYTGGAIQTAIDEASTAVGDQPKEIHIDGAFSEQPNITTNGTGIYGNSAWNHQIQGADEDIIDVQADDVRLANVWVKVRNGAVNAIDASGGPNGEELFLNNVETEGGITGAYINVDNAIVSGFYGQSPDNYALRVTSGNTRCRLSNIGGENTVEISGNENVAQGVTVDGAEDAGIFIGNNRNVVSGTVKNTVADAVSGRGVVINGNRNVFYGASYSNNSAEDLVIGQDYNAATGQADYCLAVGTFGDVLFTSNANNCKVIGTVSGTVTDNGTGNSVV